MNRITLLFAWIMLSLGFDYLAFAGAVNFQEPVDWTVGDAGSTFQEWQSSLSEPFVATNNLPTTSQVSPAISSSPSMSVQSPGYVSGSGNYYSHLGDYQIRASVFNHGGTFGGGGPYSSNYGTRVFVQTAATTNPDFDISVFVDSIELVKLDGTPILGGSNEELLSTTELFRAEVQTPVGPADQQELGFEYLLSGYTADFQVRFLTSIHSSFYDLRIDTMIVESTNTPGDFDGDGDVDADDLGVWQAHYGIDVGGDTDGDGDTDGRDFLTWQRNFTGPNLPLIAAVPEPTAAFLVICAALLPSLFTRPGRRVL